MSARQYDTATIDTRFSLLLSFLDEGEDMTGTNYVPEEGSLTEHSPELDKALTRKATAEAKIAEAKAKEAGLQLANIVASNDANRVLYIDGPILEIEGGVSCTECRAILMRWSRRDPKKDITIYLNTQGGAVFDGNALLHTFKELREKGHKVTIKGLGTVMSLGTVLLQGASEGERVLDKDTVFMIHAQSGAVSGSIDDREDQQKMLRGVQERHLALLAERSTLTVRQIKNKARRKDWFISAEEALEYGFCDRIE